MKIRLGFVSNSSSSSYIIDKVPKKLVIKKDTFVNMPDALGDLCDLIEDDDEANSGILPDEIVDELNSLLDKLKNNKSICKDNHYEYFDPILELLKENDLIMMTLDGPGGDGEDLLIPFEDERKKK